jgi:hypothetical protein
MYAMSRKPRITAIYEATPAPVPQPVECGGLMCIDMNCKHCWGFLDDIDRLFNPTPGVAVDLDEAIYAALGELARRQGTTVSAVAQVVLRRWAARQARSKGSRRGPFPGWF